MANKAIILCALLVITVIVVISSQNIEKFDMTGLVYNRPPNWYLPKQYDPTNWLVRTYPDAIEASCMPYSRASKYGSLGNINYLSNAARFWRM